MKDIDFDELDRAVNSIIGGKDGQTPPAAAPAPEPVPTPAANPPQTTAEPVAAKPQITGISGVGPRPVSPAARRGGRFMDVVHPSSDMKTNPPTTATPPKKTVIAPLHDGIQPTRTTHEVSPADLKPDPDIASLAPDVVSPVTDIAPPMVKKVPAVMPDPLDMLETKNTDEAEPVDSENLGTPAAAAGTDESEAVTTPFLSDTKVEKRPLGAFADGHTEPPSFTETQEFEAAEAAKKKQTEDLQLAPEVMLPPEYQPDLVAIEAKEQMVSEGEKEDDEAVEQIAAELQDQPAKLEVKTEKTPPKDEAPAPETPKLIAEPAKEPVAPEPAAEVKTAEPETPATTMGGSIAPQYSPVQPAGALETPPPLYGTDAYHQPLLPAKTRRRTPVWAWIVLALGLLVVGAGIGALLFILGY